MSKDFATYLGLSIRNFNVFIKDRTTLFISMLAPLIILFLYMFFLKQLYLNTINTSLSQIRGVIKNSDIDTLINSWLLAGVLATSCLTVAINSLSVMVNDKQNLIDYDYSASPVKGVIVVLSYFTGALLNTLIISGIVLSAGLIMMYFTCNFYYSFFNIIELYFILIIGCFSAVMFMMFIVSFFRNSSALSAFCGIICAVTGFFIGAFVPISNFSNNLQYFANIIPGSHVASLCRNSFMVPVLNNMNKSINNIDGGAFITRMNVVFSLELNFFSNYIGTEFMYLYVALSIGVFFLLNILFYRFVNIRK